MLKAASEMLSRKKSEAKSPHDTSSGPMRSGRKGSSLSWSGMATSRASTRLTMGPAMPTTPIPTLGDTPLKARGLMGTGRPHPSPTKSMSRVPHFSRWASGLSVSLPISREVSSPSMVAASAWAASCRVKLIRKETIR